MKVHNVRLGLANNSSSTHSIIFLGQEHLAQVEDALVDGSEFGWQYFTAKSQQAKANYVALTLYNALNQRIGHAAAAAVANEWAGTELSANGTWGLDGYVDHQSCFDLPRDWEGRSVDQDFFNDFKEYFLQDRLVLLGGNDNDEEVHPLRSQGEEQHLPLAQDVGDTNIICRSEGNGHWTLFNRYNGAKFRVSFDIEGRTQEPLTKSSAPELVDLKITDWCPFDCAYCYMDSTQKGEHGDMKNIKGVISNLARLKVFEVAIGGGEPTMHPDFLEILKKLRMSNIVPNFTTKSLKWLRDPSMFVPIADMAGSFAFSVEKAEEVDELAGLLRANGIRSKLQVTVQLVMGVVGDYEFLKILKACQYHHIGLTLLGYKTTGRGGTFEPKNTGNWVEAVKRAADQGEAPSRMGIDIALAADSQEALEAAGVDRMFYATEEGQFSMYIDAVDLKMAPSSYCASSQYHSFTEQETRWWKFYERINDVFARF